jgi:hypothetical protein
VRSSFAIRLARWRHFDCSAEVGHRSGRYRVEAAEINDVNGADQLFDGMGLSVRLPHDFTVSDTNRLLVADRTHLSGI